MDRRCRQEVPGVSDRGSIAIEAALVLPILILVILAGFEVSVLAMTRFELVAAAREGARVAATVADPVQAVAAVRSALDEPLASRVAVTVRRPPVPGRQAEVLVRVVQEMRTPLLDALRVPITVRAVMAVEP